MARPDIASAVADALRQMGVEVVTIDRSKRHPQVRWSDRSGSLTGIITVPGSASDRRSMINNITMARRLVRHARGE